MIKLIKEFVIKILNLSEVFRVLNESYRGYRRKLLVLTILGFLTGFLEGIGINILIPVFSFFTDGALNGSDSISRMVFNIFSYLPFDYNLTSLLILVACVFLVRAFVQVISSYIAHTTRLNYKNNSVRRFLNLIFYAQWPHLLKQRLGYIQTTLMRDIQGNSDMMTFIGQFIISITSLLVYLAFAISISFPITVISLVAGGILGVFMFPLVRKNRALSEEGTSTEKNISSYLIENIGGAKVIKSFDVADRVIEQSMWHFDLLKRLNIKIVFLRSSFSFFVQPLGLIFISALFAYYYQKPGFNLPSFIVVVYLIQKIFSYLEIAQTSFHNINEYIPFLKNTTNFKKLLENNHEDWSGTGPFRFQDRIELSGVSFSYKNEAPVLSGLDMFVKKGETIGLIGQSGAGKTSIADLFLRLFVPNHGTLLLDGVDVSKIELRSWRKNIGYVSQDAFLLNDSIGNNIKFYDDDVTEERVVDAAKRANIYDFILKQKEGFGAIVGERGVMLSGGQKQRIALARVLARNPEVLILDEATSSLDNESEALIQKSINDLRSKITILIIAHRLSTIFNVDRLLVLDNGKITEEGTPSDLLKNPDSYFHRIYHLKNNDQLS